MEEEFLKSYFPNVKLRDDWDKTLPILSWDDCAEVMEAYKDFLESNKRLEKFLEWLNEKCYMNGGKLRYHGKHVDDLVEEYLKGRVQ